MKYDSKHQEQLAQTLGKFFQRLGEAGPSIEAAGKNIMKMGCSMMVLALIGIILIAVIF